VTAWNGDPKSCDRCEVGIFVTAGHLKIGCGLNSRVFQVYWEVSKAECELIQLMSFKMFGGKALQEISQSRESVAALQLGYSLDLI